MKKFYILFVFICFFACTKDEEIGTKIDDRDYKLPVPPRGEDTNEDEYDEYFKEQWHLTAEQNSINIIQAWKITRGQGVKVAVLDDGIQKSHEDFENIEVYNIITQDNDCEPTDRGYYSHGTAVAGIIAARQNKVGTIGVAPECDFLFIGDSSENIYSDEMAIRAFEYAKNWGAKVINCSWGSYAVSSTLSSQIKHLYDSGIVLVFACGNDNKNMDAKDIKDESELPWVIGVSASNQQGNRANFSNYGRNIDIMAPGTSILALDLMGVEGSNNGPITVNNNYCLTNGTSFSSPIVAGVAALMLAVNPSLKPSQVKRIITQTAQKVGDVTYNSNGFSLFHAYGLIDAAEAVKRAIPESSTAISE